MSEQELIAKVCEGNSQAFSILVNQHKDMVYSLALQMCMNPMQAEEFAQDIFLRVYEKIAEFNGKSKLSSWIYRITINYCYTKLRKKRTYEVVGFEDNHIIIDENLNCLEQMELKDCVNCIKAAISELEEMDAIILILFYFEDFSIEEIIKTTGFSKANVKVKLYRARKKLLFIVQSKYPQLIP